MNEINVWGGGGGGGGIVGQKEGGGGSCTLPPISACKFCMKFYARAWVRKSAFLRPANGAFFVRAAHQARSYQLPGQAAH